MSRIILTLVGIALAALIACTPTPAAETPTPDVIEKEVVKEVEKPVVVKETTMGRLIRGKFVPADAKAGGTLVRLGIDPATLDPHLTTDATSAVIIVEVFGGLVTINPDLEVVSDLAKRWDISNDGRTYTFNLDEGGMFHNGKPVTAKDFKWSLERAANPKTGSPVVDQYMGDIVGVEQKLNAQASAIEGVQVIDDRTLEITIDAPKSYFLSKLTYPTAFVLDRENVESGRRWFLQPNGTGPFKFDEYLPGERLLLKRHDGYHLGAPLLDEVRFILSGGVAMLMYESDEIDITGVGLADLDRVLDRSSPLNKEVVKRAPSFSTSYLGFNVTRPPLDDPKVRQALNYAINREEIANIVLADLVIPARGILPPGFPGYNPGLDGYTYNLEKAKQLLKESKYADNLGSYPIDLTTPGSFGAANVGLDLEVILRQWEDQLGVKVNITQTDFATFLQDLQRRRFQMFDIGWIADYPDPQNFLDILFHSESSSNHTAYNNPKVDNLLEQARVERDQKKRFELYHQVEQILVEDSPWVPLWHSGESFVLIKPWVKNYYLPPLVIPQLRYVYIDKQ